jgi:hypothetical protein
MTCRYCNIALAPSRSFVDGEFCCDDHRQRFELEEPFESEGPSAKPVGEPVSAALAMLRRRFAPRPPVAPDLVDNEPESLHPELELAQTPEIPEGAWELSSSMPAEPELEPEPVLEDESYAEGQDESVEEAADALPHPGPQPAGPNPARETAASWRWLNAAWNGAPRDLKLVALLLPVLLVVAVTGSIPKTPIQQLAPRNLGQVQGQVQKVVEDRWKNLNQTISDRAAVAYADDFRSGLDAWESRSNLTRSWSYDAAGFVRPGPLAVFKPTVDLSDYRFEFLGEIDQKAMGWAFRAEDLNNYYAMKFVVVKPGPLPLVYMVRYAVINGKEGPHVDKPLPMTVRADMLYRIQVNARGGDFTIMAQGQVVDFWSDNRLQHGGVGFFSNRGERARLRWVEVSHQYDALGRLCAYLAPYGIEGRNGNIN